MKILIYTHEFPPFAGGIATYTADLAKGLNEIVDDVGVLAPRYRESNNREDKKRQYHVSRMFLPANGKFEYIIGSGNLMKELIKFKPDTLLITDSKAINSASIVSPFIRTPYFLTVHGTEIARLVSNSESKKLITSMEPREYLYKNSEGIIAVSRFVKDLSLQAFPLLKEQVEVIYQGIDPFEFKNLDESMIRSLSEKFDTEETLLLSVARLIPSKGHDNVLRALAGLKEDYIRDFKYIIVGKGPAREDLEELSSKLNLSDRVVFTGKVPERELRALYYISDIFVLASRPGSRVEGFGRVFLEAGAFKLPVIAGRTGGVPEAVKQEKTGLIIDPTNPQEIASAIKRLKENEEFAKQLGINGNKRVKEELNYKEMSRKTLKFLDNSLERKQDNR